MRKPRKQRDSADDQAPQRTHSHEESMSESNAAVASADVEIEDGERDFTERPATAADSQKQPLQIKVSAALLRKLTMQAQDEGVSLDEFIGELLAESVVLRAWEIVERKAQMRGGNTANPQNRGNHQGGGNRHGGGGNKGGGNNRNNRNHQRYHTLMEDKAAFLEYVRNQERKQR